MARVRARLFTAAPSAATVLAAELLAAVLSGQSPRLSPTQSQTLTQKMTARLTEEADAFRRLAPDVIGQETLVQRARKGRPRFRPRIGAAATKPPKGAWQRRTIVSEYGFSTFGEQDSLHELRQVISVDGHKVTDAKKAQTLLADVILAKDSAQEIRLLRDFEKHGLIGAATDFGQLILLFTPRNIVRYEFSAEGPRPLGPAATGSTASPARALVFSYTQIDGPAALKLFDGSRHDRLDAMRIKGEIWVRADNFVPLRITMVASRGEAAETLREEATVNYVMSSYGALLPSSTHHRELRGGDMTAENDFTYAGFHKFGASSDIQFQVKQ
jgi:hypothetical protein